MLPVTENLMPDEAVTWITVSVGSQYQLASILTCPLNFFKSKACLLWILLEFFGKLRNKH